MRISRLIWLVVAMAATLCALGARAGIAHANVCDRHPDHWKCQPAATPTPTPSATPTPSPTPTPTPTPTGNDTCGQQLSTAPPAQWSHVVWIVMENKAYGQIIGSSSAPYTNSLASKCGLATNYSAVAHPSLPNYIAMTSGGTQGVTDDASPASHPLSVPSIFSQLPGGQSGSLEESMPSNCLKSDAYPYAVKHNPEAYFTNLGSDCANNDVPLGSTPDVSRRFTFATPNMCHDTHDCSVATGDSWLAGFIPKLVATPDYQAGKTVIFLTYDEDDSSSSNHVVTEVISAHTTPGARSADALTHYNLLATTEDLLGLGRIGNAVGKASMAPAFGLSGTASASLTSTSFVDRLVLPG